MTEFVNQPNRHGDLMKRLFIAVLAGIPFMMALGQEHDMLGHKWPARLHRARDIKSAKADIEDIDIRYLPIQDYPLLVKFRQVKNIGLDSQEGTFATDDKLKALAGLGLTNMTGVNMTNCRLITDDGIRALSRIKSLKGLGLEGTAVTDTACQVIVEQMRLTGLDVANCSGVGLKGIKALTASDTLTDVVFSASKISQDEVLDVIASFKNVTRCTIIDSQSKLDTTLVKRKGVENRMKVFIRLTGSLQDTYGKAD